MILKLELFANFFRLFEMDFWRLSLQTWFLVLVDLKQFFGACRLKISWALIGLKIFFRAWWFDFLLVLFWFFLAFVDLKTPYCFEFLAFVNFKMFFWRLLFWKHSLVFVALKMIFGDFSLICFFGACLWKKFAFRFEILLRLSIWKYFFGACRFEIKFQAYFWYGNVFWHLSIWMFFGPGRFENDSLVLLGIKMIWRLIRFRISFQRWPLWRIFVAYRFKMPWKCFFWRMLIW